MAMLAAAIGGAAALSRPATAQNQNFDAVQIDTVKVRDNIYMLVGAGGNQTVQFGDEGVLVVDTQFAPLSAKLLAAIRTVTDAPIRHIVNTHMHGDHIGGNENFAKAGRFRAGGNVVGDIGGAATATAHIIAHENVLTRLSAPPAAGQTAVPFAAWPNETFFGKKREFLFNGEAVQIIHQPNAHTDGDSVVFFRKSDVLSTGDLFTTVMYPFIDVANGGSIDGYVNALNAILDITVASNVNEGGTLVIPGHGRLSDEQDVIEYRDMATIVRDRIREYVKRGMTLDQVKAKQPTLDFDGRYATTNDFWTPAMFIETIYKEMAAKHPPAPSGRHAAESQPDQDQERPMSARQVRSAAGPLAAVVVGVLAFGAGSEIRAQRASEASTPQGETPPAVQGGGGRGGRGRGAAVPQGPARQTAPVDLTGNWVSVVTEDWQWRMRTPAKGDYASVPLTPAGRQAADTWTEAKDGQCEAYGVGGLMRIPGRLRISWQDDSTLKIESDAGQQTRLLRFAPPPGAAPSPVSSAPGGAVAAGHVGGRVAARRRRVRRVPGAVAATRCPASAGAR